mmetsp:Transcript_41887/g.89257  ORF Transcript_41887/g.89257 Transcript_41887/m.89257 type:complete len:212 (+) Transcript_41887:820-1455(+)
MVRQACGRCRRLPPRRHGRWGECLCKAQSAQPVSAGGSTASAAPACAELPHWATGPQKKGPRAARHYPGPLRSRPATVAAGRRHAHLPEALQARTWAKPSRLPSHSASPPLRKVTKASAASLAQAPPLYRCTSSPAGTDEGGAHGPAPHRRPRDARHCQHCWAAEAPAAVTPGLALAASATATKDPGRCSHRHRGDRCNRLERHQHPASAQ